MKIKVNLACAEVGTLIACSRLKLRLRNGSMAYRSFYYLKYIGLLLAFFVEVLASSEVFAETSGAQLKSESSVYNRNKGKKINEDLRAVIEFDVRAISYMEASAVDNNFQQQAQLTLNLKKSGTFFSETNLVAGTFSEAQSFYYAVPQIYAGFGQAKNNITVGRKKENLSFADSFYNFGLIQANFTNDYINFIEGGLTGVSAHFSFSVGGVIGTFMPIFIPNQGPQIRAEDGRISTSNRWAPEAPTKFKFDKQYSDINYAIHDYKLAELVSNSGYALHAYIGQNKTRPMLLATYAKKPINEIAFSRDTYADIANFEGYVYLTPVVLYHEVQSMDLNLDFNNFKSTLSFLGDQPQNISAQGLEVMQTLSPLNISSIFVSLDLTETLRRKLEIYTGAAIISGGEIADLNSEKKESFFTVNTSRTQYKKPLRLGFKSELFFINDNAVTTDVSTTYDQQYRGSLLSAQFSYLLFKKMNVSVGADLIGVENELPADAPGNFLHNKKANDRFFAGLLYAF